MAQLTLALSGGGAAGLGHIPVLEALDDLGLRPDAIAGSSMGALLAAGYAAGMPGAALRAHVEQLAGDPIQTLRRYLGGAGVSLATMFRPLDAEETLDILLPEGFPERFEDLEIPLTVIATDYCARCETRFDAGPLRPALAASMAIPGVFCPVRHEGRIYIDGGVSNNLPLDALPEAEVSVAVDVASLPPAEEEELPGPMAATTGAMRIMLRALMEQRIRSHPPTILIRPESRRFGVLDFRKVPAILEAVAPVRAETRDRLAAHLGEAAAARTD